MVFPPDFEARTVDFARDATRDIGECAAADVSVQWYGAAPMLRFVFGRLGQSARPALGVQMITESRKNPLAPGRLLSGDELRRHIRKSVEAYLKVNGIEVTRKAFSNAHV